VFETLWRLPGTGEDGMVRWVEKWGLLPGTGEAGVKCAQREKRCALTLREAFSAVRETCLALRERRSALH
jgi:hypothetical protein